VTYTPPAGFAGLATLTYTATDDARHHTSASVEIVVGVPPSVPNKLVTVINGRTVDISLPVSGQDGRSVVLHRIGRPAHGTAVLNPDGTVTYVPDPGFSGTDSFTYEVIDADGNVAQAIVHVIVPATSAPNPPVSPSPSASPSASPPSASPSSSSPPPRGVPPAHRNRPPAAADDTATLAAGDAVVIRPLLNDHDPDGDPLTIVAIRPPRHGSVIRTRSTITYRADAVGADALGYTIDDGHGGRATASVTIRVVPVAALPTTGHNVLAVARAGLLAILTGAGLWLGGRHQGTPYRHGMSPRRRT